VVTVARFLVERKLGESFSWGSDSFSVSQHWEKKEKSQHLDSAMSQCWTIPRARPQGEAGVASCSRSFLAVLVHSWKATKSLPASPAWCLTKGTYKVGKDCSFCFLFIFCISKEFSWCLHYRCEPGKRPWLTTEWVNSIFSVLWQGNNVNETWGVKKWGIHYKILCTQFLVHIQWHSLRLRIGTPMVTSHCHYFLLLMAI